MGVVGVVGVVPLAERTVCRARFPHVHVARVCEQGTRNRNACGQVVVEEELRARAPGKTHGDERKGHHIGIRFKNLVNFSLCFGGWHRAEVVTNGLRTGC